MHRFAHACCSARSSHKAPPNLGGLSTLRLLFCSPMQWGSHFDHSDHSLSSQFSGQLMSAHVRLSVLFPSQSSPRPSLGVATPRLRVCPAPPQDTGQSPHSDQSAHLQSTQWLLHCRDSAVVKQGFPPCASLSMMGRLRAWVPLHHGSHIVHAPQSPYWQSIGHGLVLQFSTCMLSTSSHWEPPPTSIFVLLHEPGSAPRLKPTLQRTKVPSQASS
mmetsp:Transcript_69382/g.163047  ORF Transcript_69382/g.163047 Transcript_69382/m.163047 type:complete len:216 (-) Transcript_69382:33-680(-)